MWTHCLQFFLLVHKARHCLLFFLVMKKRGMGLHVFLWFKTCGIARISFCRLYTLLHTFSCQ
jgi:hypothetical protein